LAFQIALGSILFIKVSTSAWYDALHDIPGIQSGLLPINISTIFVPFQPGLGPSLSFQFAGILSDSSRVTEAPFPTECAGRSSCVSYYFPGSIDFTYNLTAPILDSSQYSDATTYIQVDAPGYQVSFYPLNTSERLYPVTSSCYFSGLENFGLQICVVQNGSRLLASKTPANKIVTYVGYNVCPPAQSAANMCLQDQDWRTTDLTYSWVTITRRRATTIFDRFNFSIIDVVYLDSIGEPTNYSSDDFYPVFDLLFTVPSGVSDVTISFAWEFLSWFTTSAGFYSAAAFYNRRLQQLMTLPVVMVNNGIILHNPGPVPPDMGTLATLAKPLVRVHSCQVCVCSFQTVIHAYAFWIFLALNVVFLVWSMGMLVFCWFRAMLPEDSAFSDIDFVSRCITETEDEDTTKIGSLFNMTNIGTKKTLEKCHGRQVYCKPDGDEVRLKLNQLR
jgi:hypothetical protein